MNTINVGGVEQFSLVDYPEKISATIFMQGCPWRCPFCHNASLQPAGLDTHFIWDKFLEFLGTRKRLLDAVVFSGGEPLMQDTLPDAIIEVKALGFTIGLHTGGYRPEHLANVLPLVDWVGLDIKAPFEEDKYQNIVGVPHLNRVKESLDLLLKSGIDFECRTTCDPRFLSADDLKKIAETLKNKGVKKYFLQKYRPIESDKSTTDDMCERLVADKELLAYLKENFEEFEVRK